MCYLAEYRNASLVRTSSLGHVRASHTSPHTHSHSTSHHATSRHSLTPSLVRQAQRAPRKTAEELGEELEELGVSSWTPDKQLRSVRKSLDLQVHAMLTHVHSIGGADPYPTPRT
jgi:hypothetical protein